MGGCLQGRPRHSLLHIGLPHCIIILAMVRKGPPSTVRSKPRGPWALVRSICLQSNSSTMPFLLHPKSSPLGPRVCTECHPKGHSRPLSGHYLILHCSSLLTAQGLCSAVGSGQSSSLLRCSQAMGAQLGRRSLMWPPEANKEI